MSFSLYRTIQLDPNAGDGGGGGGGAGAGAGASGGAGTGAGAGSGSGDTGAGGAPAWDPNEFTNYKTESERRFSELSETNKRQSELLEKIGGAFGGNGDKNSTPKEPKRSDFPTGEAGALAFIDARADYRIALRGAESDKTRTASEKEQAEARATESELRDAGINHNKRIAEAQAELPDFAAVVGAVKFPFGDALSLEIMKCDNSAHVVRHLAATPADMQQLWLLEQTNPRKAQRMLDLLDEGFTSAKKTAASKNNSNRFQPTAKTGGKTGKGNDLKDTVRSAWRDDESR